MGRPSDHALVDQAPLALEDAAGEVPPAQHQQADDAAHKGRLARRATLLETRKLVLPRALAVVREDLRAALRGLAPTRFDLRCGEVDRRMMDLDL